MERRETFWRIVLLAPALIVFSVFVLWPLLDSFRYSFTNWNGFNPNYKFVGFDNFAKVFSDPNFFTAIINTAIWMVAALVLPTLLGLGLALLLNTGLRGAAIFKSIFYLPICLSAVIVGQIWIWIYQPDWGLLNTAIAHLFGLQQLHLRLAGRTVDGARLRHPRLVVAADRSRHGHLPGRPHLDPARPAGGRRHRWRQPLEADAPHRPADAAGRRPSS